MQIYFLHKNPIKSAEILCKKSPIRARKMVIEFMQAVAYLCEKYDLELPKTKTGEYYKTKLASKFPKPLINWLEESDKNYSWVIDNVFAIKKLMNMSNSVLSYHNYICVLGLFDKLPDKKQTPFPNYAKNKAKGLDYTHLPTIEAYNKYLNIQIK